MAWCFSTRVSVATVLTTHPCVSRCLRVKKLLDDQDPRHNMASLGHNELKGSHDNKNPLITDVLYIAKTALSFTALDSDILHNNWSLNPYKLTAPYLLPQCQLLRQHLRGVVTQTESLRLTTARGVDLIRRTATFVIECFTALWRSAKLDWFGGKMQSCLEWFPLQKEKG